LTSFVDFAKSGFSNELQVDDMLDSPKSLIW